MSVSYYTNTVVGVRLSDLGVETSTENTKETRYDNKTGAPYEIDVKITKTTYGNLTLPGDLKDSLRYFSEDGRDILEDEAEDGEYENPFFLGEIPEFFDGNNSGRVPLSDGILGYCVASVSDWNKSIAEIDAQDVFVKMEELKDWLKGTLGVDCQVKLYSVMHVSC